LEDPTQLKRRRALRAGLPLAWAVAALFAGRAHAADAKETSNASIRARIATATALTKDKQLARALPLWVELAALGPYALEPAQQAGRLKAELENGKAALDYCTSFLKLERASQAIACGQGVKESSQGGDPGFRQFWIDATASLPVIAPADIDQLLTARPDLKDDLASVGACRGGFDPVKARGWPEALDPRPRIPSQVVTEALYLRLAESTANPVLAHCFLSVAASRCIQQLVASHGECRYPRTIARFAESLATRHPARLGAFLDAIFAGKSQLYFQLDRPIAQTPVKSSLLQLHLALAYVFTRVRGPISGTRLPRRVLTSEFHVKRARELWTSLHPGDPMPAEMLAGIVSTPRLEQPRIGSPPP
jgi:hypothetical protein